MIDLIDLDPRVKPGDDERKKSPAMTRKNKVPGDDERKEFL